MTLGLQETGGTEKEFGEQPKQRMWAEVTWKRFGVGNKRGERHAHQELLGTARVSLALASLRKNPFV